MTDRPTKVVVNCSTGEQTIEFLSDEEITQMEADRAAWEAQNAAREAEAAAKAAAKESGIAKLLALGLTEEEANAIIQ